VIQPIYKNLMCAAIAYIFYEGMGHNWAPNPGVDYAHSCNEEDILPWNRRRTTYGFRTLPGRMKIATAYLNKFPSLSKISFVQNSVCAFTLFLLTFDVDVGDKTIEGRSQFGLGAVAFVCCTISTMGYATMLRWQLNNWMRWFKETHKNHEGNDSKSSEVEGDNTNTPASLAEPLLQEESDVVLENDQFYHRRHHLRFSKNKQYAWYAAAAGAFISWLVIVSGSPMFDVDYTGSLTAGFQVVHREESYASFVIDQFTDDDHSPFMYRFFLFLAFAVMGFFIPSTVMFLCFAIEACKDYGGQRWFRDLVNTLQYMYPFSGHEPLMMGLIIFFLECYRVVDHVINRGKPPCESPNDGCVYITPTFTVGAGFFISWVLCLVALYFLTKEKYFKYTLQI